MNEVSGKANEMLLAVAAHRNIPADRLVEGLPITLEQLRDPRRRVDWDLHVALVERLQRLCGGPEALEHAGAHVHEADGLRRTRAIAGIFLHPRHCFWMGCRWLGPSLFSHLTFEYAELDDGRLRVAIEIPSGYRASEAFFVIVRGALRATPQAVGYPEASVELHGDGRRAVYTIEPPRRLGFRETVKRLVRLPFAASRAIEELSAQQRDLNLRYEELSRAQALLGAQSQHLETIDALGRQLIAQIESQRLGDGLLEALKERFGWKGAALWIGSASQGDLELLSQCGGGAGPAHAHALTAGGRMVGRLDVWGPDRSDDPSRGQLFQRMLPWIAMAVANAHARPGPGGSAAGAFRWTGENGKDLFLIVDDENTIRYAGPTIEPLLGFSQEDAVEKEITSFVHPDDWPGLEQTFGSFLDEPGSATFSGARVRHKDGSWRVMEGVGIKVLDERRRDVFMISCTDVTDRRRAH